MTDSSFSDFTICTFFRTLAWQIMNRAKLRRMLKGPIRILRHYQMRGVLGQLVSQSDPTLLAIHDALREAFTNTLSPEEKQWSKKIEKRRSSLLRSTQQIDVIDFGSGGSDAGRTMEDLSQGVRAQALVSDVCEYSKSELWTTFLFKLLRKLKPASSVELGSCVGISASYMAAALALNGKGHLISLEGSPEIARIAEETLSGLDLQTARVVVGPFHQTLAGVMEAAQPVDFFFNDGHHDHDAVIHNFNVALPYLAEESIIVFDDIAWSAGMKRAWTELCDHPRVVAAIDLHTVGITVVKTNLESNEKIRIGMQ